MNPDYDSLHIRSPLVGELIELIRYRDLLQLMVSNLTKIRYKRSKLGIIWSLLNPLLNMVVMSLAFSSFFRTSLERYPVYVLSGLIFWQFFLQTTTYGMNALVWGGRLMKRIYLPRTIFTVAAIGNGLINLLISLVPLVLIMLILGHPLYPSWWMAPLAILLLAMFSLGVALFLSTLAVFFADVVEMYQVLLQALFFLTPIMYPKDILPAEYVWFMNLNPMYNLIELFRAPVYLGMIPGPHTILAAVAVAIVSLLVGWAVFTRKVDEFAYRI